MIQALHRICRNDIQCKAGESMVPKVSIIIPFYNCEYIDQAIKSALGQTYANIEIIVVDDGSTFYQDKINPYKKRITYIYKQNGGTATAVNRGIEASTGDYFAWLSSDDLMLPDKILLQMEDMLQQGAEMSFTDFDVIDEHNHIVYESISLKFKNDEEVYEEIFKRNPVNGSTVIMKKSLIGKVGFFDPKYKFTHDYEMWLRLITREYRLHYFNKVLTRFRTHPNSGTSNNQLKMKEEIAYLRAYYRRLKREH
jgi:teichuronic acid biosynthesis glycosyltransferase TuaG